MKIKPFGHTGIQVSELVLGGGFVGGFLLNKNEEKAREILQLAVTSGINWIDTAATYGNGRSESAIGKLLSELPVNLRPKISSKVAITAKNKNDIAEEIRVSLSASLARLKVDRIDLLMLHNAIGEKEQSSGVTIGNGSYLPLELVMG